MKLIFIGSGSAFTFEKSNYNSNILLVADNNKKLLIDCGSDARHALGHVGYSYQDITDVYISHVHADHVGGLEWLALTRKFDAACNKPRLYANEDITNTLWDKTLAGGLNTIQNIKVDLDYFFDVHPIAHNASFVWNDIRFQLVQTIHIFSDQTLMPSYGLIFEVNHTWVYISTDTRFHSDYLAPFYEKANIIFHDCETIIPPSGVHAHYTELITLDSAIKSKMWLYHYHPGPLPDAIADGFCGFVKRGQIFEL